MKRVLRKLMTLLSEIGWSFTPEGVIAEREYRRQLAIDLTRQWDAELRELLGEEYK